MTPEQFAYWLQGCAELNPEMEAPTPEQWKSITEHLKTVFVKVTPEFQIKQGINWQQGTPTQQILDAIGRKETAFPRWPNDLVVTC